jgi:hypothetical protein
MSKKIKIIILLVGCKIIGAEPFDQARYEIYEQKVVIERTGICGAEYFHGDEEAENQYHKEQAAKEKRYIDFISEPDAKNYLLKLLDEYYFNLRKDPDSLLHALSYRLDLAENEIEKMTVEGERIISNNSEYPEQKTKNFVEGYTLVAIAYPTDRNIKFLIDLYEFSKQKKEPVTMRFAFSALSQISNNQAINKAEEVLKYYYEIAETEFDKELFYEEIKRIESNLQKSKLKLVSGNAKKTRLPSLNNSNAETPDAKSIQPNASIFNQRTDIWLIIGVILMMAIAIIMPFVNRPRS